MPSLEQPRGQAIKKGGKKVEAAALSGVIMRKPEELAKDESVEIKDLKQQVKDLEVQIEAAEGDLKQDLEKELDEVQDKLARKVSVGYKRAAPITPEEREILKTAVEKTATALKNKRKEKTEALKKRLLPKIAGTKDMKEIRKEQEENDELAASLAEIKKLGKEKTEKEKLATVREKLSDKPADEVYLSNWPKKEEAKPEEKPFTKTEEAWFQEGEKASESGEEAAKLEETAKKRSASGMSPKISAEEPPAIKAAKKNLEDSKKRLEEKGIDVDSITGGWINRTQIKLQFGGFFSKKSKEIGALYDAYVKAQKEVIEMTAPTGNAAGQRLRGIAASGRRTPSGGPFGRP